jgi:hypothetical protein
VKNTSQQATCSQGLLSNQSQHMEQPGSDLIAYIGSLLSIKPSTSREPGSIPLHTVGIYAIYQTTSISREPFLNILKLCWSHKHRASSRHKELNVLRHDLETSLRERRNQTTILSSGEGGAIASHSTLESSTRHP